MFNIALVKKEEEKSTDHEAWTCAVGMVSHSIPFINASLKENKKGMDRNNKIKNQHWANLRVWPMWNSYTYK